LSRGGAGDRTSQAGLLHYAIKKMAQQVIHPGKEAPHLTVYEHSMVKMLTEFGVKVAERFNASALPEEK